MKSFSKISGLLLLLAVTGVSCSNDNEPATTTAEGVAIAPQITKAATRADVVPYTSQGNIELYYASVGSEQQASYSYQLGAWATTVPLYWNDLQKQSGSYPFFAVAPAALPTSGNYAVQGDQSTPATATTLSTYEQSDLLMAYTVTDTHKTTVGLNFRHILAQIVVTLGTTTGADKLTADELATASLSVNGVKTGYTLNYTGANSEAPATATASGDAANITPLKKDGKFYLIAPVQNFIANSLELVFTITIAGKAKTYTWKNTTEAVLLEAGKNANIAITVNRTGVMVGEITVKEWEDGGSTSGSAAGDDISQNINISFIEVAGVLEIETGSKTATYDWKEVDGQFKLTLQLASSAIYWDDLNKYDDSDNLAKHTFNLTFTPYADGTPEKDVLEGSATISWGAKLDANSLAHVNAKLIVNLEEGDGFLDGEFEGADKTIEVHGFKTEAYKFKGNEAILEPATLRDAHKVVATVDGHEYTVQLSGKFEKFLPGRKYTLKMMIHKEKLGITIGEIEDWTEGTEGTGEFEY